MKGIYNRRQTIFDIIIQNGKIVDGSGQKAYPADIGIENGRITEISPGLEAESQEAIDADGYIVSPGFIDMHSHADWVLPWKDHPQVLKCLVEQGITSVVGGNCGISPAPMTAAF